MAEGDAAADEALAAADVLGLDSAWSDTAVSQVRARATPIRRRCGAGSTRRCERARRSGDVDVEMRVLFNLATVAFEAGRIEEALTWTRRATRRARDLGIEWSFYPAELRHLQVTALYMAGDWDASLAEADLLARVPEMAAHVRAAGLLVLVGRGRPGGARAAGLGAGADPAAARARAAGPGDRRRRRSTSPPGTATPRPPSTWRSAACRRLQAQWDGRPPRRAAAGRHGAGAGRPTPPRRPGWSATGRRRPLGAARGRSWSSIARSRRRRPTRGRTARWASEAAAWLARVEAEAARLHGEPAPELWRAAVEALRVRARVRAGAVALAAGRGAAGGR